MEKKCSRVVTDDDVQKFRQQLSQYKESSLRILYSYFWNDLKHIIEILDTHDLLRELTSRNVRIERDYLLMKKKLGASTFSECLMQDIKDLRRKAILALWESLFVLQNKYQHPNLIGLLAEFSQEEDTLVSLINLDEEGHDLHELKETHECHKKHLLKMTKGLEEHNAPGDEQPRQSYNIYSCYLDLIVVSSQKFRKRSQREIIETGGRLEHYLGKTHTNLERITPNRLFRWCHHSDCIPHAVMVSGVPGIGKTTLMQKFVYDWVTTKHYQRFSFVFFFKFRDLNRYGEDKVSLDKLISEHYPYLWTELDVILQDPKKLLFLFDGLDESIHNIDFGLPNLCCNPSDQVNLGVIVVSLVRQSLLKGSSILLTGRPTQLASIDTCVFQRVSEIMGFLPKERETYFENFFKNDELSTKAFQYVRENDALYTFCYIPSYCWIVCKVLSMCFEAPPQNNPQQIPFLPKTTTQLFVSYVANTLINHCTDNECPVELIKSIGKMAQYGIKNHILTFDHKALESFKVDIKSKSLSSFVIENNSHSTTYSFLHLTIQEFFSALIHYLDSEIDLKSTLDRNRSFKDGPSEMVIRFLCGLSDKTNSSLLSSLSLSIITSTSEQVTSWLSQEIASKWTKADPREKMNMLTCLFESRHTSLVQDTIGPHSHRLDFSDFHLTPMDCTVLAFILESCGEIDYLNLDRCFIQSEGLERLAGSLHTVRVLRLSNNDLKDSDMPFISKVLTHEACRVQILSLKDNSLTSCSVLACVLNMNQSLVELDLSRNNLACPDFSDLMEALSSKTCTIARLLLQQIKLTDEHSPFLISLSENPNLNHLDLSHNFLTDASAEDIKSLILCSQNLTKISIEVNDFTEKRERILKELESFKPGLSIVVTNKEASDNANGATKRHS